MNAPTPDPVAVRTVHAELIDPQRAHAALPERHRIFRARRNFGIPIPPGLDDYQPDPYQQRVSDAS